MTNREFCVNNTDFHPDFCTPYFDESGKNFMIVCNGKPIIVCINGIASEGSDEQVKLLAQTVNPDYDLYKGYDDTYIAIQAMKEAGCASCPYNGDCQFMDQEAE